MKKLFVLAGAAALLGAVTYIIMTFPYVVFIAFILGVLSLMFFTDLPYEDYSLADKIIEHFEKRISE